MSGEKRLLDNDNTEASFILDNFCQLEMRSCWCLLKNKNTFQKSSANPDSSPLCTGWLGHARGMGDISRSSGGWGGTLDHRETPQTSPQSSICSSYNLVSSCQFVIAASYTFLSTLALPWSLPAASQSWKNISLCLQSEYVVEQGGFGGVFMEGGWCNCVKVCGDYNWVLYQLRMMFSADNFN